MSTIGPAGVPSPGPASHRPGMSHIIHIDPAPADTDNTPYDWANDGDFETEENPYARASRINDPGRWNSPLDNP